jgi:hypothetical protein
VAERLYFKLWIGWYTCESHADLSGDALSIGPVLMSFCIRRWVPGVDLTYAVNEKGAPVTVGAIARRVKWTSKKAADALLELESVGTCVLRSDGAWGFSKFGRWQESADAARKRRVRGQSGTTDGHSPAIVEVEEGGEIQNPSGSPPSPPLGVGHESPANDLPGEESPGLLLATQAPPKPRASRKKPRAPLDEAFAQSAYAAFCEARIELTRRSPQGFTETMRDELAKLVAACAPTIDDWRGAVRIRLAMDRRGEGYGSLTWASLTAPKNFERWALESQKTGDQRAKQTGRAPVSSHPTESGVIDLKALMAAKERS